MDMWKRPKQISAPVMHMPAADRIAANVRRFELALDQCEKPAKKAELQANLAYWRPIQS